MTRSLVTPVPLFFRQWAAGSSPRMRCLLPGTGSQSPILPTDLQPMVGSCFSLGMSPSRQVSRHIFVSTDASAMGWGAMCNGHAAAGLWTGPRLRWHINCLELLSIWLALHCFKTLLHDKHVLVRTENTANVTYINHQGGLCSCRNSPAISSFGVRSI